MVTSGQASATSGLALGSESRELVLDDQFQPQILFWCSVMKKNDVFYNEILEF